MFDSLQPHGLYSPWNSPGQNTGVGSLSLLQGIFPTQESNQGLLHCRWMLYQLSYQGSPVLIILGTSHKQNQAVLSFCVWFISFNITSSRFIHVVACVRISFLVGLNDISCPQNDHILFTHSSTNGCLGAFHLLAIVNSQNVKNNNNWGMNITSILECIRFNRPEITLYIC